jgi:hypothetical protein
MKHLMTLKPFGGHQNGKYNMYTQANVVACIALQRNGNMNSYLLYIGSVFGSLNSIQIGF